MMHDCLPVGMEGTPKGCHRIAPSTPRFNVSAISEVPPMAPTIPAPGVPPYCTNRGSESSELADSR